MAVYRGYCRSDTHCRGGNEVTPQVKEAMDTMVRRYNTPKSVAAAVVLMHAMDDAIDECIRQNPGLFYEMTAKELEEMNTHIIDQVETDNFPPYINHEYLNELRREPEPQDTEAIAYLEQLFDELTNHDNGEGA